MHRIAISALTLAAAGLVLAATARAAQPAKPAVPDDLVKKITDAAPAKAQVLPAKPRKLLVYTLCHGFKHGSIPVVSKAMEIIGQKTGAFEATVTDDPAMFAPDKLAQFDAVCLNNTTGELFSKTAPEEMEKLRKSLLDFVSDGKGLVGIHAATDCSYKWEEFGKMIGGFFAGHPYRKIVVRVECPDNPVNAAFKGQATFEISDEIYTFKDPYSRESLRVLLGVEMEKSGLMSKTKRPDGDHALAWIKPYGKGRVFYSAFGHDNAVLCNPLVLRHYLDGIQYALGDLKADDSPSGGASAPPVPPAPAPAPAKQFVAPPVQPGVYYSVAPGAPAAAPKPAPAEEKPKSDYVLPAPDKDGWIVLFDGADFRHWQSQKGEQPGPGWTIQDKSAVLDKAKGKGGDMWTRGRFGDFVLELEFLPEGNSGVFVRTDSMIQWLHTGIEIQVLNSHGKAEPGKHDCGAVYDCLAPTKNALNKPGEWNRYVITCDDNKIEVELNGQKIIDMDLNLWTQARKNPDGSPNKFNTAYKDMKREGHIGLQDHGAKVSYRNIRVKPLVKK